MEGRASARPCLCARMCRPGLCNRFDRQTPTPGRWHNSALAATAARRTSAYKGQSRLLDLNDANNGCVDSNAMRETTYLGEYGKVQVWYGRIPLYLYVELAVRVSLTVAFAHPRADTLPLVYRTCHLLQTRTNVRDGIVPEEQPQRHPGLARCTALAVHDVDDAVHALLRATPRVILLALSKCLTDLLANRVVVLDRTLADRNADTALKCAGRNNHDTDVEWPHLCRQRLAICVDSGFCCSISTGTLPTLLEHIAGNIRECTYQVLIVICGARANDDDLAAPPLTKVRKQCVRDANDTEEVC